MDSSNIYIIDGTTVLGKGVTVENYLFWHSLPKNRKNIREFRKMSSLKFKMGDIEELSFSRSCWQKVNYRRLSFEAWSFGDYQKSRLWCKFLKY